MIINQAKQQRLLQGDTDDSKLVERGIMEIIGTQPWHRTLLRTWQSGITKKN